MSSFKQSPSQTVGPFYHNGLIEDLVDQNNLYKPGVSGQKIIITGIVYDGDGDPIIDAMVEIWQADSQGIFDHPSDPQQANADPHFNGHGRSQTVKAGQYSFTTIKPGIITGETTPFINVRVFARGMLIHAITRLYFSDETGNGEDTLLNSVPAERQGTLIATLIETAQPPTYQFDLHLQGEKETVFFNP